MNRIIESDKDELKPFWHYFGQFFQYLNQEKLYYVLVAISIASLLTILPIILVGRIIAVFLFLLSYKIAFEVLILCSKGEFLYRDNFGHFLTDMIGVKAILPIILQLGIYILFIGSNPPLAIILIIILSLAFPVYLMILATSQSVVVALNPITWFEAIKRIGSEYYVLSIFYILVGILNGAFNVILLLLMPTWLGTLVSALLFNFSLILCFLAIGFVMYRHSDELGIETLDVEEVDTEQITLDPIKQRVLDLMDQGKSSEVVAIIKELKENEGRNDLDAILANAEGRLIHKKRQSPRDQLSELVENQQMIEALKFAQEYLDDGHALRPKKIETLNTVIKQAYNKQKFALVCGLIKGIDKDYPENHQDIVDNYYLVAQILYQKNQKQQAKDLLESLIKKYQKTANITAVSSYLKGIKLMNE